jgi:hypothetical protein
VVGHEWGGAGARRLGREAALATAYGRTCGSCLPRLPTAAVLPNGVRRRAPPVSC